MENPGEKENSDQAGRAWLKVSHQDEGGHLRRSISFALDRLEPAVLKSGKHFIKEISPGHHRLRIDNTFLTKTVEFDVKPGEQAHFKAWNRKGFGSWLIEIVGSGPLYLSVERLEDEPASELVHQSEIDN